MSNLRDKQSEPCKYLESNAGDGTLSTDHHMRGLALVLTLLSCFFSQFISALDQTIVTTTYSTVGNEFNAFDKIGWLNIGFLVPMCTLCPIYGKISIVFGRKKLLIIGIVIFEIGSLVGALSNSMGMLIGGRVIQGTGAGCIQTLVSIIVTESVPVSKRLTSIAIIAIAYSIASILGPFIGGSLTTKVSWRWCFYINLPFGVLALVLLILGFRPPPPTKGQLKERLRQIDLVGQLLLTTGLVLSLIALTFGGVTYPWASVQVILLLTFGGLFLVAFIMYNFIASKDPIILREFITTTQIFFAACAGFCNFAMFLGNVTYITVYFQVILNHSAWKSGVDLIPLIVSVTLTAVFNGVVTKLTHQVKLFYILGGVCGIIGTSLMAFRINEMTPTRERVSILIITGISLGFLVQCTLLSCQIKAPSNISGSLILVTTFVNFMRFLGGTFGVTISTIIFQTITISKITSAIQYLPTNEQESLLQSNINPLGLLNSPEMIKSLPSDLQQTVYKSLMMGISGAFYFGIALLCLAFIFSLFATNKLVPKNIDVVQRQENGE